MGGAQLAPARRDVADLVGRTLPVAEQHDPGNRYRALEGQEEQELAGLARRQGELAHKPSRRPAIADLTAMGLVVVEQPVDRVRAGEPAHLELARLGAAKSVAPIAREPAPQRLAAGCQIEPRRAVAGDHWAHGLRRGIFGRPDQHAPCQPGPDVGQHRSAMDGGHPVQPDRATQEEASTDGTEAGHDRPPAGSRRHGRQGRARPRGGRPRRSGATPRRSSSPAAGRSAPGPANPARRPGRRRSSPVRAPCCESGLGRR